MSRYQSALAPQEANEELYIRLCGEKGTETIAGTWLDVACPLDPRDELGNPIPAIIEQRKVVQAALEAALKATTSPLQQAEWASMLCGGSDFKTWEADQE